MISPGAQIISCIFNAKDDKKFKEKFLEKINESYIIFKK